MNGESINIMQGAVGGTRQGVDGGSDGYQVRHSVFLSASRGPFVVDTPCLVLTALPGIPKQSVKQMTDRPMRVICAGNRRSGSTWQYNTVRLIMQLANPGRALHSASKPEGVMEAFSHDYAGA